MSKGNATRTAILERAGQLATEVGLEGMTIGRLADDLDMSKSGLFAHFRSKEELQMQIIERQRERFVEAVITPVLQAPGGEPRVRALFERWLEWRGSQPGGCFFTAASFELDDRPGPVRDLLASMQREWLESIARIAGSAVKRGYFRADLDTDEWAHEYYGLMLAYHLAEQLLRDPKAAPRVRRSFEQLLTRSRAAAAA
ncbi:MAG TPA: TetR/AcrR family transcriptional regulator [Gemmatimonadales bacterium]|jgi:AcrR family transcriptional regulator